VTMPPVLDVYWAFVFLAAVLLLDSTLIRIFFCIFNPLTRLFIGLMEVSLYFHCYCTEHSGFRIVLAPLALHKRLATVARSFISNHWAGLPWQTNTESESAFEFHGCKFIRLFYLRYN
jgi:hypothetical protein